MKKDKKNNAPPPQPPRLPVKCILCGGSGRIWSPDGISFFPAGKGKGDKCDECNGTGYKLL